MQIDATMLTAWASWVLIACTLFAVWRQSKVTRETASVQLFFNIANQYNTSEMKCLRRQFARTLLTPGNKTSLDESVLEFFETLSHLTRRGILDLRMVWSTFSIESRSYWFAAEPFVRTLRSRFNDPTLYEELEWLNRKMVKMEIDRRRKTEAEVQVTQEQRDEFLRSEAEMSDGREDSPQRPSGG